MISKFCSQITCRAILYSTLFVVFAQIFIFFSFLKLQVYFPLFSFPFPLVLFSALAKDSLAPPLAKMTPSRDLPVFWGEFSYASLRLRGSHSTWTPSPRNSPSARKRDSSSSSAQRRKSPPFLSTRARFGVCAAPSKRAF